MSTEDQQRQHEENREDRRLDRMHMDNQDSLLITLLRDQFKTVNDTLGMIQSDMQKHHDKDAVYWKKIDGQEAQMRLIIAIGSSGALAAFLSWAYAHLQ